MTMRKCFAFAVGSVCSIYLHTEIMGKKLPVTSPNVTPFIWFIFVVGALNEWTTFFSDIKVEFSFDLSKICSNEILEVKLQC